MSLFLPMEVAVREIEDEFQDARTEAHEGYLYQRYDAERDYIERLAMIGKACHDQLRELGICR